ncbi:MAG: hypothetical protein ACREOK_09235 [Gemmatimonadaceae bacterium]
MNHDAMSLAMFWTGALMVFAPIIAASIVIGVWWYTKRKRGADVPAPRPTRAPHSPR